MLSGYANTFIGTPDLPANENDVYEKFVLLTSHREKAKMDELFARLQNIERESRVEWLRT